MAQWTGFGVLRLALTVVMFGPGRASTERSLFQRLSAVSSSLGKKE